MTRKCDLRGLMILFGKIWFDTVGDIVIFMTLLGPFSNGHYFEVVCNVNFHAIICKILMNYFRLHAWWTGSQLIPHSMQYPTFLVENVC